MNLQGKNVFIITFEQSSKAYQAFSEAKQLHTNGTIVGEQMAVVKNDEDLGLQMKDFFDFTGADKTAKGSFIGILIGILGGPLGMLLGWVSGSLIGARGDAKEVKNAVDIFEETLSLITTGSTGLIIIARQEDKETLDELVYEQLNGRLVRLDGMYVEEQIKRARRAQLELERDARKRWYSKDQEK